MSESTTVLVVEDNLALLAATARVLRSGGFQVCEAATGQQALELVRTRRPGMVLLDVVLPDQDGLSVCREIKRDPVLRGTFVVLVSGQRTRSDEQAEGLDVGADGYIARPVENRELLARMRAFQRIRQAELDATRAKEDWERTFDAVPDMVVLLDQQHHVLRVNRAVAQRLGYPASELVGRPCYELMHGTTEPPENCPHQRMLREGVECRAEVHEDHLDADFAVSVTPFCDVDGKLLGGVHVSRDITHLKRLENELRRERDHIRQRYAVTVATSLDGLWEWDLGSGQAQYSDRWAQLLGFLPDEVPGTVDFFRSRLHPDDAEAAWTAVKRHLSERTTYEFEFRLRTKDEAYRWFLCRGRAQSTGAGRMPRLAGVIQDVTDRKNADASLKGALAEIIHLKERLETENLYLQDEIKCAHDFEEIVGQSPTIRMTLHKVEQVAGTDASVLLLGETGTGKELLARSIHARSTRGQRPLVKVNCAALPNSLIESELFGHVKGAFTGALTDRVGRFELADGGTLFLDEIGELRPELQVKLLRVLQDGEFERIGSTHTQRVDVRLIAATNRELHKAMDEGSFRPDLYYRLSVFPVEVPPLRARREDIPLLVWHFVAQKQRQLGKTVTSIHRETMRELTRYDWPGNVRELANVIERAMILTRGSALMLAESLSQPAPRPSAETRVPPLDDRSAAARPAELPAESSGPQSLDEIQRAHLVSVLEQCGWRIKGTGNAAARLGLAPNTLRARMRKLGISRPPQGGSPRRTR